MEVVERRNFFRVPVVLPVKYSQFTPNPNADTSFNRASMLDLSGGGMLFETPRMIQMNDSIVVRFSLPYNEKNNALQTFHLQASVIRSSYEDDKNIYNYGVEFINIASRVQDRIIKFLFDLQIAVQKNKSAECKLKQAE
ncbi:PilZ domain-containing protein [bacterium]|nr:PilZ domain-containing protein [bacterium]MCP5463127.1 PilZ domain-containing protein [bacterium]